jgi:regulator of sirC expression with transglutaminase-like and TPR domain
MVLDSRITWEKLGLELELLSKEEPRSLLPLLIAINSLLQMDDSHQDRCSRAINFMTYELAAMCEKQTEADRFQLLNDFIFTTRDFRVNNLNRKSLSSKDLLLNTVLEERGGAAIPVSLLYMHLAQELDLPIFIVNQPQYNLLKWVRGSKCQYIDVAERGKVLDEEELLKVMNLRPKLPTTAAAEECPSEAVSLKTLLLNYLNDLKHALLRENEVDLGHAVLSMILKVEPTNLRHLGERALLRKQMGHLKEAQQDLKRYFSFVDISNAPTEIQMASKEIQALSTAASSEVIH